MDKSPSLLRSYNPNGEFEFGNEELAHNQPKGYIAPRLPDETKPNVTSPPKRAETMGVVATDSAALRADLRRLTPQLVDSVLEYSSTTADSEQDFAGRAKVVAAAQAIVDAAQPPQPAWMNQSSACAELVALRLFIEWGAFEAMPSEGSISFQDLADKISADMQIVREFHPFALRI